MVEEDFVAIADAIDMVLADTEDSSAISKARNIAMDLCRRYPLPY
jgi:glycine/serine hydroxymethyltransferase